MKETEYRANKDGDLEIVKGIDIEEVVIPDEVDGRKVVAVRQNAFKGCSNIRNIIFGRNLKKIGKNAFRNCTRLEKVVLNGISFDISAFDGCTSIRGFEITSSEECVSAHGAVYSRDRHLLIWPAGRKSAVAVIEPGTRSVRSGAFRDCLRLRKILFPPSVEEVEDGFAVNCPELECYETQGMSLRVHEGILYRKDRLISCPPAMMARRVRMHPSTRIVGEGAFRDCRFVSDIELGSEVSEIGRDAFKGLTNLRTLSVPAWFGAELPFEFLDRNMHRIEGECIGGRTYTRENGRFVETEEITLGMSEERPRLDLRAGFLPAPESSKFEPAKVEGISFDDIAGHEDVKEEIRDRLILPVEKADLFRRFGLRAGGGVLMYGPPGTGKTMLAQAVAAQLDAPLISVKSSDLLNKFVGNTEANVKALFEKARSFPRAVIFFDDFDSIGRSRNAAGSRPWVDGLVNELLTQMQGLEQHSSTLLVLAATNRPWNIDSALTRPGRFDILIHVPLPDDETRAEIFRKNLEKYPCGKLDYALLSEETEGYNAADIVSICRYAKLKVVKRAAGIDSDEAVTMEDLMEAVECTPSSVSPEDLIDMESFGMTGHPARRIEPEEEQYIPDEERELVGYY